MKNPICRKRLIAFLLLFSLCMPGYLSSQVKLDVNTDIGKNNVSEGLFFRSSAIVGCGFDKNYFQFGSMYDILGAFSSSMSGLLVSYSREFMIREHAVTGKGFFLHNSFSEFIYEYNWGLVAETMSCHFEYRLGVGFKTYGLTRESKDQFNIENSEKICENFNLLYSLTYYLKPADNVWNAGLYAGNIDLFQINQATNPFFGLLFRYQVSEPLQVFSELYYRSAGAFNLSVNPFGYNIRAGITWKIRD